MRSVLILAGVLISLVGAQVWGQESKIVARPLTPQEIANFKLPTGTQIASGLFTVGVGSAVYLEALVAKKDSIANPIASWSLGTKPSGSTAALAASLLGADIPTYIPGERELYEVGGRQLLVPDKVGQYKLTATVGDTTLSATITAATYVGYANCVTCHEKNPPFTGTEDGPGVQWPQTGHASIFTEGIEGVASDHYAERCISCHTTGYDKAPTAVNGGFDDVQAETGWTFPAHPAAGEWDKVPAALQAKANIQCESCHGPGSQHNGNVADNRISASLNAGDCGQCHDRGTNHRKNAEWSNSGHAAPVDESGNARALCAICHSGKGVIERFEKDLDITQANYATQVTETAYEVISCAVCHDPHDATNEYQLRRTADVTLITGEVVSEGGVGKMCMNCHKARRGGETYAGTYHTRHNPHGSPQTDMLVGTAAAEYGEQIRSSSHLYAVEGSCAGCHMQETKATAPEYLHAGGHTFAPSWDGGTPDDPSDDVDLTGACVDCHGPMTSFDIPKDDYDGDGKVEGVQTEVAGLMTILAKALPPIGQDKIVLTQDFTEKQLKGLWNYNFVYYDGSHGIHNTQYAVGILKASIKDLTGRTVAAGGTVRVLHGGNKRGGLVASSEPAGKLVPGIYGLYQNAPNPFNPETEIRYEVPEPVSVRISIYNALGQQVRTLVEAHHAVGEYSVTWDGRDADGQPVTAGMYIYRMEAGSFTGSGKMVLLP